jgi:hypothetical protein
MQRLASTLLACALITVAFPAAAWTRSYRTSATTHYRTSATTHYRTSATTHYFPTSQNLISWSEDLTQSAWVKTSLADTTYSADAGPFNNGASFLLSAVTSSTQHYVEWTPSPSLPAGTYTLSVYGTPSPLYSAIAVVPPGGWQWGKFQLTFNSQNPVSWGQFYNLEIGTETSTTNVTILGRSLVQLPSTHYIVNAPPDAGLQPINGYWWRFATTFQVSQNAVALISFSLLDVILQTCPGIEVNCFGDGVNGLMVSGIQLVRGTWAGVYTPTSGTPVTTGIRQYVTACPPNAYPSYDAANVNSNYICTSP